MSDPAWPTSTVPDAPEYNGYGSAVLSSESSFKPEVGPPTSWRRSTLEARKITASFAWTTTQRDAFYTFYFTTLKNGTVPFQWDNPAFSATGRYKFDSDNPPAEEAIGYEMWRVTVSVYRLGNV